MEKAKALLALLMTFVIIIGIVTPCLADEDIAQYTTEESTEQSTEAYTESSASEYAQEQETSGASSFLGLFFSSDEQSSEEETATAAQEETVISVPETVADAGSEVITETAAESTTAESTTEKVWSSIPFINEIYKNGVPAVTTQSFTAIYRTVKSIANLFQGRFLWNDDDIFDVTLDERFYEICEYMSENSCLDPTMILTNVPDLTEPATIINTVFQIDVTEMREELYAKVEELNESGDKTKADLVHLYAAYMSGIKSAYIYLQPRGDDLEVALDVTYSDGSVEKFVPGIYYDPDTGLWYGKSDKGLGGTGFNCNTNEMLVYAPMYCWMRKCGFCVEYDILCYLLPVYCYNTRRIKFEYAGKEWMIQMWKGNYLITNGGEIGVYNREPGSVGTYYDCVTDDELLPMSLKIYHGNELLVDMPETPHWWVNGFKIGTRLYSPHSLTLIGTIKFDNEEMLQAFCAGVDKNIYHDIDYTVDGLTVTLCWDT